MEQKGIDTVFIRRIAIDEWQKFKRAQDKVINEKLKTRSGTLTRPGSGRRYSVRGNGPEVVASLLHPDYERYQDIKKLKWGRTNAGLAARNLRKTSKDDYESQGVKTSAGAGHGIHNRLIWGRMNTIAFRLFWDLKGEVFGFVRREMKSDRTITINT